METLKDSELVKDCISCTKETYPDGYGEFIHVVVTEDEKIIVGDYMCHKALRRDDLTQPRFQLSALPA